MSQIRTALASLTLAALAGTAIAQAPPPAAARAPASKDPAAAIPGTYKLDPNHASVIAKLAHGGGISYSTFRFNGVSGSLDWNPAQVEASKLIVKIDPKSIDSVAPGFADELIGERFLNTAKYPDAGFVSTAIARTGPTTGRITGDFTFMGVTKPLAIDATLVGAGKNGRGANVIGFSGTTKFRRSDFGFTAMNGPIGDEVEISIDLEFNKPAA
jgi:polyisoprenoid-binding protein YceI